MFYLSEILLWLFIINIGTAFGAGIYEARIVVPEWVRSPLTYQWPNTGLHFWAFVTTIPLTLLTIANLIILWQTQGASRNWWLGAVIIIIIERISTFTYFIPRNIKIQKLAKSLSEPQIKIMVKQWSTLNYFRNALSLLGWLAALQAFFLLGKLNG